jgi:hypothetical protein
MAVADGPAVARQTRGLCAEAFEALEVLDGDLGDMNAGRHRLETVPKWHGQRVARRLPRKMKAGLKQDQSSEAKESQEAHEICDEGDENCG